MMCMEIFTLIIKFVIIIIITITLISNLNYVFKVYLADDIINTKNECSFFEITPAIGFQRL